MSKPPLKAQASKALEKEEEMQALVAMAEAEAARETPCAEAGASCWSRATLSFLTPVLGLGQAITLRDIGRPLPSDLAAGVSERFKRTWAPKVAKHRKGAPAPDLFAAQLRCLHGGLPRFLFAILCFAAEGLLQLVPILCLRQLVKHFEEGGDLLTKRQQWSIVALLYLAPSIGSLCRARYDTEMVHFGVQMYSAASLALYEKALRLAPTARAAYESGRIVTLFTVDAFSVQRLLLFIGIIFTGPMVIVLCLILIHQLVGEAMWIGLGFMAFCIPLQIAVFVPFLRLQKAYLKAADDRVKLMNEVLSGVRVVKYLAWERPFLKKILKLREKEANILWKQSVIIGLGFAVVMLGAPIFQPVIIFTYYCRKMGRTLDASTAFSTLSLFSLLRLPLAFLPFCLIQFLTYRVSAKRMANFLVQPELGRREGDIEKKEGAAVFLEDATCAWSLEAPPAEPAPRATRAQRKAAKAAKISTEKGDGDDPEAPPGVKPPALAGVSLEIAPGALVGVVGRVGAGKSSLLAALGGEMEAVAGTRGARSGAIAYCAQVPWVLNATLRDNVVFGGEYDEARFRAVVRTCALKDDLAQLPGGDLTEIGEKGINLSGGQKARVSLARAAYSAADVVFLDDPLSAVDAHVAVHLFDECIAGDAANVPGSLSGRTRVLVTHHAAVLPACDVVVVVRDGRIAETGTYEALRAAGVDMGELETADEAAPGFAADVGADVGLCLEEEEGEAAAPPVLAAVGVPAVLAEAVEADVAELAHLVDDGEGLHGGGLSAACDGESGRMAAGKLVRAEDARKGLVSNRTWIVYAKQGGWPWMVLAIVVLFTGRGSEIGGQFFLARWTSRHDDPSNETVMVFVHTYLAYASVAVLALAARALVLARHRIVAANRLHAVVLERVLFAPTAFFDVTPLGRLLNRFSADLLSVDSELSRTMSEFCGTMMYVIGAVGAIVVATKGTFLALFAPLGVVYRKIDRRFRLSSTQIARLAKLARSPVIADFTEVLSGVATVRSYDAVERFESRLRTRLDALASCVVVEQLTYNWLSLRLDQLAAFSAAMVAALAVGTEGSFINPGYLGLALASCIEVTSFLKNAVRLSALLSANMASVERLGEYGDCFRAKGSTSPPLVPVEAAEVVRDRVNPAPDAWVPAAGALTFTGVEMRYRDGPLVLKGVDFAVEGGASVGVVGRTGSGKSSLTAALFRVVEICGGTIEIDGVDTASLGLRELRRGLFIIPQDPVLFSATLRFNVDPFDEYDDAQVTAALVDASLGAFLASLPLGLADVLSEGGSNLSVGQRQLVCIARALLRKPRVLVLDEATASIDNETDAAIQRQIRTNFAGSTTITIAHRLHTILDSDKILVLDEGRVLEYDAPAALLARPDSHFTALVNAAKVKKSSSSNLLRLATEGRP